ncbi:MAG: universal stress protein, partial [Myxococcota bacterium]
MSNTILVPVDFSEASRAAIQRAQSIARSEGGRLRLLHAHPAPGEDLGARLTERLREALRHDAKLRLAAFAATCDDGSTPL